MNFFLNGHSYSYGQAFSRDMYLKISTRITIDLNYESMKADLIINNYGHEQLIVIVNNDLQKVTCSTLHF